MSNVELGNEKLGFYEEFQAPPMQSLRGGHDDGTEPDAKEDLDDDELDVEQNNVQILSGKDKDTLKDPEEEAKKKKRKRRMALALLILLAIVGGVVGFLFGYSPEEGTSGRLESDPNATNAPTEMTASPTEMTASPTEMTASPTEMTESPTAFPTTTPKPATSSPTTTPKPATSSPTTSSFAPSISTQSPTFSIDQPLSVLSCEELLVSEQLHEFPQGIPFKETFTMPDGRQLCADTYVGFPNSPTRNPWTAKVGQKDCWTYDYVGGTEICEDVGARRCTADELQFGAGQGSGCGGDNFLLYSGTECVSQGGESGFYTVNLELKKNATFFECETDLTVQTLVRCCGDFAANYP